MPHDKVERWWNELFALSPTMLKLVKKSFDDALAPMREQMDRYKMLNQVDPGFFAAGGAGGGCLCLPAEVLSDFSAWR